ncbi:hypothetical protein P3T76_015599 [Phytophthora citrophthora]|uniref:Reverse transcriptase zinc-binding domain-containing protein n=1 Tax=Phytophthora citrophthora TaxID=4793 RepID=A0AAD9LBA5_9STRA|nr:hypothetical protein P3T76_015599 [Phytophthora citrophthora]
MPYWQNHFLRADAANRLTGKASANASLFYGDGYVRLQDFIDRHGSYPTKPLCLEILNESAFTLRGQWSNAAGHLPRQVERLMSIQVTEAPLPGPHLPREQCAASHGWTFDDVVFLDGANHHFYHLLHKKPAIQRLPHTPLGIVNAPKWIEMWKRERTLNKDVLPILADIKFRLQHNGLNVRSKYQHQTTDVLCVHGCGVVETARHLFWDCSTATTAWQEFLPEFRTLLTGEITWEAVVYTQKVAFTQHVATSIGAHNMLRVFNVLRCSVLYILWLHHNDCMMNGAETNHMYVISRARSYVTLHLDRLRATGNPRLQGLCGRWLRDHGRRDDHRV